MSLNGLYRGSKYTSGPRWIRWVRCAAAVRNSAGEGAMPSGVVLRQVVAEEAGGVCYLQELQPLFIELMQGSLAPVDPIKQSKGHLIHGRLLHPGCLEL